jgi:hypothetical protein
VIKVLFFLAILFLVFWGAACWYHGRYGASIFLLVIALGGAWIWDDL